MLFGDELLSNQLVWFILNTRNRYCLPVSSIVMLHLCSDIGYLFDTICLAYQFLLLL